MGFEKQIAKPNGYAGKIIGKFMNMTHTKLYVDYFKNDLPSDRSRILDIGCGGGQFIKFLSDTNDTYQIFGIDHSSQMVSLSKRINKDGITRNQVRIIQGSVTDIITKENRMDLVTAFETVQFWSKIDKIFVEILKLLQINGSFVIINRYPEFGTRWWKRAKIKSEQEYVEKLEKAGFTDVIIDLEFKKGWVVVKATKP